MSDGLNILQIAPRFPWPPTIGGNIGIFNISRALSRRGHRISYVCFASADTDISPLAPYCDVHIVEHDTRTRAGAALANLFSPLPYTISKYRCERMTDTLRRLCREQRYDIVHVDHIHMAPYGVVLHEEFSLPLIIREHNFETTIYERFAAQQRLPLLRWYMLMQSRRLLRFESRHLASADRIAAITPQDAARMRELVSTPVDVIPAGVELDEHRLLDTALEEGAVVTLLGSMAWEPNRDAAEWFLDEVWPRIVQAAPASRLVVAGDAPPRAVRDRAGQGIDVPGLVEDLEALLSKTTVLVVPLRIGGGMRIKLLEYFARGKAVVSTTIGAEGNIARHGEHLLLADEAGDFAAAVLRLLGDATLRRTLGAAARLLAEQVYSWDSIGAQFEDCYLKVAGREPGGETEPTEKPRRK